MEEITLRLMTKELCRELLQLKQIDRERKKCTLSIHLQNDSVKGHGYGTEAERQALKYAFETLKMNAVNADSVIKNTRSQHVLEKAGFSFIEEKDGLSIIAVPKPNTNK